MKVLHFPGAQVFQIRFQGSKEVEPMKKAQEVELNLCVPCTIEFQSRRSLPTNPTVKGIPEQAWR